MNALERSHYIKSIRITRLFGRYNYTIPSENQSLHDVNIIYGLNGSGKTTLLKLVFHLLSPSETSGHRHAIAGVPFAELVVTLSDGTTISATKDPQLLIGPVTFAIANPNHKKKVEWNFVPNEQGTMRLEDLPQNIDLSKLPKEVKAEVTRAVQRRHFFDEIGKLKVRTYMLTSDRILQGDFVEEHRNTELRSEVQRGRGKLTDMVLQHRVASVNDALESASSWIQTKAYEGSYGGGQSASTLYQDVVKKIVKTTYKTKAGLNKTQETRAISTLVNTIIELETRANELSEYGFTIPTISTELLPAIQDTNGNRLHLIASILEPYLGGVKAKLDALSPLYELVNSFVSHTNNFLYDKKLTYDLFEGLAIYVDPNSDNKHKLTPSELSSGEQQLLLLFCHVLTARDSPSVFIIDEPELSLNVMWQRSLVSSLQEIAKGSDIQFIFASHSLEILTKHRNRVVSLQEN